MTKARGGQIGALAWTHACAFGGAIADRFGGAKERVRTEAVSSGRMFARCLAAIGVLPVSWISVVVGWMRGGLYASSDGRAMVVVRRRSMSADAVMFALLMVGFVALFALLQFGALVLALNGFESAGTLSRGIAIAYFALFCWLGVALLLMVFQGGAAKSISSVGEETPAGERWVVESLAARTAADGVAALRLAVRAVRAMPSGRVLVAVARTRELEAAYVKLGLTAGAPQRVYTVT